MTKEDCNMIQPIKQLRVRSLTVSGFKGFAQEESFTFGDITTISGHNGQGKSSIADAIAFAITGVSFYGGAKLDHLYHKNTRDISVTMTFADESGAVRRLSRRRVADNMDIFLDGQRVTQRDLTIMFGERDLFLSIFNPRYFIDVLCVKGRDLLERYLPDIPHQQIMDSLSEHNRALLEGQDFLSAETFAKKLREDIAQLKRDAIYTQGQYDLQSTQAIENAAQLTEKQERHDQLAKEANDLEARRTTGFDGSNLEERLPDLYARYEELLREQPAGPELTADLDAQIQKASQALEQIRARGYQSKYTQALSDAQARIDALGKEVSRQKHILSGLKPGIQCPMCKQTVTEATLPQVRTEFENSVNELCRQGREQTAQLKQVQELDAKAKAVFDQFKQDDTAKAEQALNELTDRRSSTVEAAQQKNAQRQQEIDRLHAEIQNTELDLEYGLLSPEEGEHLRQLKGELVTLSAEISVLTEQATEPPVEQTDKLNQIKEQQKEKENLLSALAAYIAKRVELSLSQLQMNRVAISLYEVAKTTGEIKDVFKFTYEDRPYVCLSGSERIRAGLEVAELVKSMVGVDYPVFIDDAERVPVIDNVRPTGQIFIARVVKNAKLTVTAQDASPAAPAQAA